MIYSPVEFDGRRQQRRTIERIGDELFEFQATVNPIEEPREDAWRRIEGEFQRRLTRDFDRHYGVEDRPEDERKQ